MPTNRPSRLYLTFAVGVALIALVLILGTLALTRLSAARRQASETDSRLRVLVAVDPLAYLVERIGGDRVAVSTLTPPGKDPESFSPTPSDLAALSATRLFFRVGLPIEERFAQNIASFAPNSRVVDLCENVELLSNPCGHSHSEADGDHSSHPHSHSCSSSELDPHVWTSPAVARLLVRQATAALCETSPENAEFFQANAATLDAELAALQTEISQRLAPFEGRAFVVFHPAYGYFANEFHLTQRAIESQGKAPRPRELAKLSQEARADGLRATIVQPEFDRAAAQVVAKEIGAELIVHSPLEKDYFANLRALTDALERSFAPSSPTP
ncbi:MAG: zinc ABC transporter substrate-binding protein [Thermoguttaceae bacterium]|nr:zinc ABC transporter substrate-binding protein [Thermoguttaceae bacterium]MBQ6826846.1 zinc ABC transporter substrate-binding protein [Thermoguttaceae bacterium]